MKTGSQSAFAHFVFSPKMFSGMVENVLADASVEMPADLIHSLDHSFMAEKMWHKLAAQDVLDGFPGVFLWSEPQGQTGQEERALPSQIWAKGLSVILM